MLFLFFIFPFLAGGRNFLCLCLPFLFFSYRENLPSQALQTVLLSFSSLWDGEQQVELPALPSLFFCSLALMEIDGPISFLLHAGRRQYNAARHSGRYSGVAVLLFTAFFFPFPSLFFIWLE